MKSNLKVIARKKGLRLKDLAKELGVRPYQMSAWSMGYDKPQPKKMQVLCAILSCTEEDLFQPDLETEEGCEK